MFMDEIRQDFEGIGLEITGSKAVLKERLQTALARRCKEHAMRRRKADQRKRDSDYIIKDKKKRKGKNQDDADKDEEVHDGKEEYDEDDEEDEMR